MICFTWWGLTQYSARAIEAFVNTSNEKVCVVATKPSAPVKGLEEVLSCQLIWVNETDADSYMKLPEIPRVLFISNWNIIAWSGIESSVRNSGGKVVAMMDTNFKFDFQMIIRALRFRVCLKWRFDEVFVVGASGARLARWYGVRPQHVHRGLYGADDSLFIDGEPLWKRPKKIIYVGQLINRKNLIRLCNAFGRFASYAEKHECEEGAWQLEIYGTGPLCCELNAFADAFNKRSGQSRILINDYVQSVELAKLYRSARVFVLPSLEEHWGVVVHEAALSGCFLLLSNTVGAAMDLFGRGNGVLFNPFSVKSIVKAFMQIGRLTQNDWSIAQKESRMLASRFGPARFAEAVREICMENK